MNDDKNLVIKHVKNVKDTSKTRQKHVKKS